MPRTTQRCCFPGPKGRPHHQACGRTRRGTMAKSMYFHRRSRRVLRRTRATFRCTRQSSGHRMRRWTSRRRCLCRIARAWKTLPIRLWTLFAPNQSEGPGVPTHNRPFHGVRRPPRRNAEGLRSHVRRLRRGRRSLHPYMHARHPPARHLSCHAPRHHWMRATYLCCRLRPAPSRLVPRSVRRCQVHRRRRRCSASPVRGKHGGRSCSMNYSA